MYGSTQLPYRYNQEGQDDALARRPRQTTPMNDPANPPTQPVQQGAPPMTFAQMQAAGQARPPMPAANAVANPNGVVTPSASNGIGIAPVPQNKIGIAPVPVSSIPGGGVETSTLTQGMTGTMPTYVGGPGTTKGTTTSTTPNFDVLKYILGQLEGGYTNPYTSDAVQKEYDTLGQQIDDQYNTNVRTTNNNFAKQGLYGSSGKDFNSGRLSDLNVGQRTAKTALGQSLAQKYADTANQFQQSQNARDLSWLNALTGFGQRAFENDVTTNELNRRADESERDYLLRVAQYANGG